MNYNNSLSLWNFDEYFLKCRVRTSARWGVQKNEPMTNWPGLIGLTLQLPTPNIGYVVFVLVSGDQAAFALQ